MEWVFWLLAGALLAALLYWLLVTTEGVFLGRRVVVWLYDRTAHQYDAIKEFDEEDERFLVIRPLLAALPASSPSLILDVATGAGRVPFYLCRQQAFRGRIVALDPAGKMLQQAAAKLAIEIERGRVSLVQQWAVPLPFPANRFDAVVCLEALEFMPSDRAALAEMVRVLRSGGFLMTSRRRGWPARAFLSRYHARPAFTALLEEVGLTQVQYRLWQLDYDLVTAVKTD